MKLLRITSGIALALAAAALLFAQADTALQRAIRKETVEGDLKGAIEQYKKLAQGSNRAVAAQALIHMGECYEKLGSKEARAQYELVMTKFADQKEAVIEARARMRAFLITPAGPTLTQICSWDCWTWISPNGRWSLYQRTDGIAIRDNTTGGPTRMLVEGASCCVQFSPDSTRVAYSTRNLVPVFVINVDGSGKRMLAPSGQPLAWSPDGTRLLIGQDNQSRLAWVRVADGALQELPFRGRNIEYATVSPDGRWIAFNASPDGNEALKNNLFLMAAEGSGETRISVSPLYQEPYGWSPNGSHLLYQQGTSLWTVPIANGHVQGPAVSVRQFNTGTEIMAMSGTGTLYYREFVSGSDLYTASMDPASGKLTSIPVAAPFGTAGNEPDVWSPDSKRLAHFAGAAGAREIHVLSPEDGTDVRVPMNASIRNSLCWPRGTNTILTNAFTPGTSGPNRTPPRFDSIRVDLATGESQQVFPGAPSFNLWDCTDTIATSNNAASVRVRNLQTGAETELYQIKRPINNHGMSRIAPDGHAVAFLESVDPDTVVLLTVSTAGGPPRELTRAKAPVHLQEVDGHSWSYDSRYVYFFRRTSSNAPYEMFRVPAAGGAEENMGLQNLELRDLHFSPDGTKISFSNGAFRRPEIWALDNFMPLGK